MQIHHVSGDYRKQRLPIFLNGFVLVIGLAFSTLSVAEYQDPIDLVAQKTDAAKHSLLLDIAQAGERLVAVGERGHILFSDDAGHNWQQADVPTRAHLNALTFIDANRGWAVGEDAVILHTGDGGLHWQRQFDDRDAEQKGPLLDVMFINPDEGVAVGVFNKIYRTQDGGNSWQPAPDSIDNLDEWHLMAMASSRPDQSQKPSTKTASKQQDGAIYIGSEMGLMFRSIDGGQSFQPLQTDHDGSFHGILARQDSSSGSEGVDQLVLVGVGGVVYTSLDSGQNWNLLAADTDAGLAGGAWLPDGRALIVGADGVILILSQDLQSVTKHQTDNGMPLSSVLAASQEEIVVVGLGGVQTMPLPR
ncbi:MAG: YCF48-related protein [Halopseudomonas sp.]